MCTCPCGHRAYAGYVAEADSLAARSGWLAERIAAGDPAPAPELHREYRVWNPPGSAIPVRAGEAMGVTGQPAAPAELRVPPLVPRTQGTPSVQTVLLAVGAFLLVVAGAVFAAVVWDRLGALGQVALMLVATFGVGALAIRLRRGLTGTAESLAAVAAGLAAVDVMAAPLLGLLPSHWVDDPTLYPAVALGALGLGLLLLHHRFRLRAWSWLGWVGLLAGAWCVVPAVATATEAMDTEAWAFAAVAVPTLTSVGMLVSAQHVRRLADQSVALMTVGAFGLATGALGTTIGVLSSPTNRNGALVTTALTAGAFGIWAVRDRGRILWVNLGAAALAGITVALVLSMPPDPQPVWLAVAVALAGLVVGLVVWLVAADGTLAATGALGVWIPWAVIRMSASAGRRSRRPGGQPAVAAVAARGDPCSRPCLVDPRAGVGRRPAGDDGHVAGPGHLGRPPGDLQPALCGAAARSGPAVAQAGAHSIPAMAGPSRCHGPDPVRGRDLARAVGR